MEKGVAELFLFLFLVLGISVFVSAFSFGDFFKTTGKAVTEGYADGCSSLSENVLWGISTLNDQNKNLIPKEGDDAHEDDYIVLAVLDSPEDSRILRSSLVYNNTGVNYAYDMVKFIDFASGDVYDTTFTSEGYGSFVIDGRLYYVSFSGSGDSGKVNVEYTSDNQKLSFENCLTGGDSITFDDFNILYAAEFTANPIEVEPLSWIPAMGSKVVLSSNYNPFTSITFGGEDYTIELVSASDSSAVIKITNSAGTSDTEEISEMGFGNIGGVPISVRDAEESPTELFAIISVGAEDISLSSDNSSRTINFNNNEYTVELVSASDTASTIRVTKNGVALWPVEVIEGTSDYINGLGVSVVTADETNFQLSSQVTVREIQPIKVTYGVINFTKNGETVVIDEFVKVANSDSVYERFLRNSGGTVYASATNPDVVSKAITYFWSGKKIQENQLIKDYSTVMNGITFERTLDSATGSLRAVSLNGQYSQGIETEEEIKTMIGENIYEADMGTLVQEGDPTVLGYYNF
ncbi:MAG: hypothetical protein ABIH49_01490 [archaeon]